MAPKIIIEYQPSESALVRLLFDDGKCGWLDIESEKGDTQTVKLKFKKNERTIVVPLQVGKYRITYRTKSKASMVASSVMTAINEQNGAMGAAANAMYAAGGMNGTLDSVVLDVDENFVLKLSCSTNGFTKSCEVISCT